MKQNTIKPNTIFCRDNLPVLRGVNTDSVDLVYLDPPFNKGKNFHAPIGATAAGAEFSDIWRQEDVKDEWHNEINDRFPVLYKYLDAVENMGSRAAKYYLIYMAVRLIEIQRILKPTGSVYLHCDPTASHYLKLLMDTIFGYRNFRNEIVWSYRRWAGKARKFQTMHDIVLFYGKTPEHTWCWPMEPKAEHTPKYKRWNEVNPDGGLTTYSDKSVQVLETNMRDVWEISWLQSQSKERTGYPTQKPLALLERIIKASTNKGDFVLDPFCGCATTCIAATRLERNWAGVDVSKKAFDLVKMRLKKEVPPDFFIPTPIFRDDIPTRTDRGYKRKFTEEDRNRKYGEQNGKCAGCRILFEKRHLTNDHMTPRAAGGGNEYENLQLLCGNCNSIKGNRPMEYLRARLKALYS